jgi:hypothetical protein
LLYFDRYPVTIGYEMKHYVSFGKDSSPILLITCNFWRSCTSTDALQYEYTATLGFARI